MQQIRAITNFAYEILNAEINLILKIYVNNDSKKIVNTNFSSPAETVVNRPLYRNLPEFIRKTFLNLISNLNIH